MTTIKHILVPIDFGPASDAAVEHAVAFARQLGARLTLLNVFEAPVFAYSPSPLLPLEHLSLELEKAARQGVAAAVKRLENTGLEVAGAVRQGSAWRNIREAARELHADLIVVGTHGRTGLPRALIGSTAEKVVRTSEVPVMTVHMTESAQDPERRSSPAEP